MAERFQNTDHWLAKAGATVFVTVLAPVLVAISLKFSERAADTAKAADPPKVEASHPQSIIVIPVMPPNPGGTLRAPGQTAQSGNSAAYSGALTVASANPTAAEAAVVTLSPTGNLPAASLAAAKRPEADMAEVAISEPPATELPDSPATNTITPAAPAPVGGRAALPEIRLFNGVDLGGFYTWLDAPDRRLGKNKDPGHIFSVKNGILRIEGKRTGGLTTIDKYSNYHLTVEYRWAGPTWPPRENRARHSGVLLHCVGPDGAVKGAWMQSIKCVVIEGSTGDLKVMSPNAQHPVNFTIPSEARVLGDDDQARMLYYYQPGAPPTVFNAGFVKRFPSEAWKDVVGFRGSHEIEAPFGQWNLLECDCDQDRITVRLNGHTVNEARDCSLRRGKIMLQSNGAAIEFRTVNLRPLAANPRRRNALP